LSWAVRLLSFDVVLSSLGGTIVLPKLLPSLLSFKAKPQAAATQASSNKVGADP
jgi:hypothetical protein